jgi:hypothetical protein
MTNDLATEIIGRVKKLLDGLLAIRASKRLSVLPLLGQRLYIRYSDWVDELLSRLYSPDSSALLFSRRSNLQLLPLSYAWFDRRWIERRKRSRPFWRQPGRGKDEDRQMTAVPEYFFEEEADEDITSQLQSTQSKPAYDIILNLPTLRTLPTGNTEFTRAGQLTKRMALTLELLTNAGSHPPWRTSLQAAGVPFYPGMAANYGLLDKFKGTTAGLRSSHLEETFYPSSPVDSSPPGLHPVSEHYTGATPMPVAGKFSLAEGTQIQSVYPFIYSAERMSPNSEPSGALPIAPGGQPVNQDRIGSPSHFSETPSMKSTNILVRKVFSQLEPSWALPAALSGQSVSEARIGSLSHLSETPFVTSNNIPARKVFSGFQSIFNTPLLASSTALMGKALTASLKYLFEPPQLASYAVPAEKADTIPVYLPEEPPPFHRDEITDMTSTAYQYLGILAPQPSLDKTWGPRQTSPLYWSAGHIPPSLTEEAISQETGEPVKAVASTIKSNPLGGYGQSTKVGLALAPIGRQRENIPAAPSSALDAGPEGAPEAAGETVPALDPEALASEVYSILKRRLIVEKERTTSAVA